MPGIKEFIAELPRVEYSAAESAVCAGIIAQDMTTIDTQIDGRVERVLCVLIDHKLFPFAILLDDKMITHVRHEGGCDPETFQKHQQSARRYEIKKQNGVEGLSVSTVKLTEKT